MVINNNKNPPRSLFSGWERDIDKNWRFNWRFNRSHRRYKYVIILMTIFRTFRYMVNFQLICGITSHLNKFTRKHWLCRAKGKFKQPRKKERKRDVLTNSRLYWATCYVISIYICCLYFLYCNKTEHVHM